MHIFVYLFSRNKKKKITLQFLEDTSMHIQQDSNQSWINLELPMRPNREKKLGLRIREANSIKIQYERLKMKEEY